jgi:hypothetical protein
MIRALILVALVAAAAANNCATTIDGKTYDFSSLISGQGGYRFDQKDFVSVAGEAGLPGNIATTMSSLKTETKTFEVQICQAITKSSSSNCSNPYSMVNMINEDGTCISLADARTFVFHQDPYKVPFLCSNVLLSGLVALFSDRTR